MTGMRITMNYIEENIISYVQNRSCDALRMTFHIFVCYLKNLNVAMQFFFLLATYLILKRKRASNTYVFVFVVFCFWSYDGLVFIGIYVALHAF